MRSKSLQLFGFIIIVLTGCKTESDDSTLFKLLPTEKTGIDFNNKITETDSFNILTYEYIYNGGGVTIGDFNNDGLQDIFFTGNEVPNRLYLNEGGMKFRDVTELTSVNVTGRWNSGAVVVDINNDGWKDIYVCVTKHSDATSRANMLLINKGPNQDGIPQFDEVASEYGIADTGFSMMAAFFDYDLDGDLDLYILTNQLLNDSPANFTKKITDGSSLNNDQFYRNNGDGTFTNITVQAGIVYEGYGLGLAVADLNNDGWPDIYVSNDYTSNDLLYINNQDGTFSNRSPEHLTYHSQFSMGNDAADFNNDGLTDIVTVDMLPETNLRKKTTINNKSYLTYINNEKYGYEYQYTRNMLHVNNGFDQGFKFSEIGQFSGIFQTEWSWSPLFADFDNDGHKDLVVTNGFPKDITDKDFANYRSDVGPFLSVSKLVDSIPVVKIPNYAFKNKGDLTFKDVSKEWGFKQPSFSNGAAYADLDNDGDLDYVVNNINEPAFVYENTLYNNSGQPGDKHYLRIKLEGPPTNLQAIGTKVTVYCKGTLQYYETQVSRGYLSSVEDVIHVGLGASENVDSIKVVWPDGAVQMLQSVKGNQVITVDWEHGKKVSTNLGTAHSQKMLANANTKLKLHFKHKEDDRIDYNLQRTLPHKFSQFGPGLSVGDLNSDGLDDIVVGGSYGKPTIVLKQMRDGTFSESQLQGEGKQEEDMGMLLFDADGDNDLDLYIVSGSIESEPGSKFYHDRFFRNDGKGNLKHDTTALPPVSGSGSCVRAADFDRDGDLDLFVGGRVVPGSYPFPGESFLLRNDGGTFTDVTQMIAPSLHTVGMVTDAVFSDVDANGTADLVIVGEFMPVTVFLNKDGKFEQLTNTGLEASVGWWNSITGGDFDNDGDIDYVAGNLGLNNGYQVSEEHPLKVFAKDFDQNGSIDAILACFIKESLENPDEKKLYPVHFWDELNAQSPRFRQQFSQYKQYGKATINDIFSEQDLQGALILEANYMTSSFVENLGNGKFQLRPLPSAVQLAPANGMVADDVNDDGNLDILMVGNDYGNEVFVGRYGAFTGCVLLGNGDGTFTVLSSAKSGFYVPGDAKALAKAYGRGGAELFIATQNQDSLKVFQNTSMKSARMVDLRPTEFSAEYVYQSGRRRKVEFYYGSGFLSQSSRKVKIPGDVSEVRIYDSKGGERKISF